MRGALARRWSFINPPSSSNTSLRLSSQVTFGLATEYIVAMQVFSRRTAGALQAAARRQGYSTATSGYAATAENLRINKDTKVIFQGFTGKQGRCVIKNMRLALAPANIRTASTPSRPLITVFAKWIMGQDIGLMGYRNQCCWWHESKESRRNTFGTASICQSQRCYQRNRSNCICDLRPVRSLVRCCLYSMQRI